MLNLPIIVYKKGGENLDVILLRLEIPKKRMQQKEQYFFNAYLVYQRIFFIIFQTNLKKNLAQSSTKVKIHTVDNIITFVPGLTSTRSSGCSKRDLEQFPQINMLKYLAIPEELISQYPVRAKSVQDSI